MIGAVHVVWITAGLGCDGDTIAMTAASLPSIEELVAGALPGVPRVILHNPVLAYENGDAFHAVDARRRRGKARPVHPRHRRIDPEREEQGRRILGGARHRCRDRPAHPDLRMDRSARAPRSCRDRRGHLRHVRRRPRDAGKSHRLHGAARLPGMVVPIRRGRADRMRARLSGAAGQLHGDAFLPAAAAGRRRADDPAGRAARGEDVDRRGLDLREDRAGAEAVHRGLDEPGASLATAPRGRAMSGKKLVEMTWDPVTRVIGSLGIHTRIDFDNREVAECRATSSIFRGYSVFMRGKDPRDAHFITSRICGICGDNHATCGVYAQNMAFGVKPPALAEWIINCAEAAEYMFDHNLFQDNLVGVDFCERMVRETNPSLLAKAESTSAPHADVHGYRTIAGIMRALNPFEGALS